MAQFVADAVLDAALAKVASAARLTVCSGQPANYAGIAGVALAEVALTPGTGNGDHVIGDGDASGRKDRVAAQSDIPITASGTATHVALDDGEELLAVSVCTSLVLTSGGTVTAPAFDVEFADVPAEEGDGAPAYTGGAGQTLIFAGNAASAFYDSLEASGAEPRGSEMRLCPATSPLLAIGSPPVDPTTSAIVAGKDGIGKAIQNIYPVAGGQPGDKFWLLNAPNIPIDKTIYVSVMVKFDGPTRTEPFVTKFHQQGMKFFGGGAVPQWSTKDVRAPYAGAYNPFTAGPHFCVWCIEDNFADDNEAFPDGHDQALQPIGPFPDDDWGLYRRFVFVFRPRSAEFATDAIREMWICPAAGGPASLVLSVRAESVGVVPDGSAEAGGGTGKQYCGSEMNINGTFGQEVAEADFMTFGGLSYRSIPSGQQWTLDWNIGDGNPLSRDTMVIWTED